MPIITIRLDLRERLEPGIVKGTPHDAIGTEARVHIGALELRGPAMVLRELAVACNDAALMAEEYGADPVRYEQRERELSGDE
jgi:hypothetical protein